MATVGIIAEYNPLHGGHRYQMEAIRERLGQHTRILVAMSGNYVQRGEPALLHKWARAEMAVRSGADLVLELPTVAAMNTAEQFALGGVSVLQASGVVTHLAFGSEAGELPALQKAADCLSSPDYHQRVRKELSLGASFPVARETAVRAFLGEGADCLKTPNNNLGVEYLRAMNTLGAAFIPLTIQRKGAAHDSMEESSYPSATMVRKTLLAGGDWESLLPPETVEILQREMAKGRGVVSLMSCQQMILSQLRRMKEEDYAPYDGGGEGLYHRFYRAVQRESTLDAILTAVKTKRYTLARLRRMALAAFLELSPLVLPFPYLRILAVGQGGYEILREMKEKSQLPLVTKGGDVVKYGEKATAFFTEESRMTDLYALGCPTVQPSGWEKTMQPYFAGKDGTKWKQMK